MLLTPYNGQQGRIKNPIVGDSVKQYFWNLLISIDQFINTLLGGFPDETMSSRMGKHLAKRDCALCNFICGLLNLIQKDHCVKSIESDEGLPM